MGLWDDLEDAAGEAGQVLDPTQAASQETEQRLRAQYPSLLLLDAGKGYSDTFESGEDAPAFETFGEWERQTDQSLTWDFADSQTPDLPSTDPGDYLPWWTKYAVAGGALLVVLVLLAPYAELGAEVAG